MTDVDKGVEASFFYRSGLAGLFSLGTGYVARIPLPVFLRPLAFRWFAGVFGIRVDEAEFSLSSYRSFDHFFTRGLNPQARVIAPDGVVSPSDSVVLAHGPVVSGMTIQAKGIAYSVSALVGGPDTYEDGAMMTFYLSPKDCHRVFAPDAGVIEEVRWIPGQLFPVREPYISGFPGLYTRNERVVLILRTSRGRLAVVMVGAFNVGRVSLSFDPEFITHRFAREMQVKRYVSPLPIQKGEWLGTFHLGSTVVMIGEKGAFLPKAQGWVAPVQYGNALE